MCLVWMAFDFNHLLQLTLNWTALNYISPDLTKKMMDLKFEIIDIFGKFTPAIHGYPEWLIQFDK